MNVTQLRVLLAKHDDPDEDAIAVMAVDENDRICELTASIGESEDGETVFILLKGPWIDPAPEDAADSVCKECGGSGVVEEDGTGSLGYVVKRTCPDCATVRTETPRVVGDAERERLVQRLSAVGTMIRDHDQELAVWKRRALKAEAELDSRTTPMGERHQCTEEHERSVEAAARRELAAEIRELLTSVSARLFGSMPLTQDDRDDLASSVERAMCLGDVSGDQSANNG